MKKNVWISLMAAGLMAACGGGGDDAPAAPAAPAVTEAVPATASTSVGGLIDYLKALVKAAADTLEPVSVAGVVPTTSETEEPRVID
ncbi:MAG: hypothetical protein HEQ39_08165 [Rhizobacter sp.]|jgi:hypothetical protein